MFAVVVKPKFDEKVLLIRFIGKSPAGETFIIICHSSCAI